VTVRQNTALSRFELDADGGTALAYYRQDDGIMTFHHTETPARLQGRGIASRLVRGALEQARAQNLKVVPRCSFVSAYLARHPEFNDLLA
jgi:predicted GNAT family acetyltransferase